MNSTVYAPREAGAFAAKHGSDATQQPDGSSSSASGHPDPAAVVKPLTGGVSTRSGAGGGGLASRRALGDITNARGAGQLGGAKGGLSKPTTRAAAAAAASGGFGLASAAPSAVVYQQRAAAAAPSHEAEDMDLIQEVDEIDMHIEEEPDVEAATGSAAGAAAAAPAGGLGVGVGVRRPAVAGAGVGAAGEELGTITKDLQGMTIKHPHMLLRPGLSSSSTTTPTVPPEVDDIDAADRAEPLACVDYVEEQYRHYREKECRPGYDPAYMAKQPHINARMRAILVDWLVEVHYKFKCCPETLYLTVNLIDRFLDRKQVPRPKLQLVGVTAFLIACKYEEIYPPEVKELVYMTDGAYTRKQIIDMEAFMLATLKFQVTVCTAHAFLVRFLKAGHADNKLYFLASYICERTLQETDILHFLPSMVAASAVYLARKNCGLRPWSPTLVHYTKYTEESLLACLRVLTPWLNARSQTLQAIRKKYGSHRFMAVSGLELEGVAP